MTAHSRGESVEWQVGGMDCAACAGKVRTAVERLPGVEAVEIALMSERLTARLSPEGAGAAEVEQAVKRLGFTISRAAQKAPPRFVMPGESSCGCGSCGCGGAETPEPEAVVQETAVEPTATPRWYHQPKGRLVLASGAALALGWAVSILLPGLERPVFSLACLVGLIPIARKAWALLRSGQPFTIEMLMTVAALGALVIGAAAEAAMVVFLFAVGEVLEGVAANRARDGIRALTRQMPATALLDHGGHTHEVAASSLRPGQIIRLRPGDRLAVDAEIVDGVSRLDESAVTGESLPVTRGPGAKVPAGAINAEALLTLRVTHSAADSTLARIARMVAEAEAARAPVERFIERFSRWYMPLIVGLAALVAVLPPLLAGGAWADWTYRALALLLIGCPCALVISVPAAMAAALSSGARRGLLVKGGAVIEAMAGLRTIAFDKTGTVTLGRPAVTDLLPAEGIEATVLLQLAAGVEVGSSHPLARAILSEAKGRGIAPAAVTAARVIPGIGAEAMCEGAMLRLAAPTGASAAVATLQATGKTVVELTRDGQPLGLIALSDTLRPEAKTALAELDRLGLGKLMLTGDALAPAQAVAGPLGLAVEAGLLPEDKLARIRSLGAKGGVMMVGDGINDAPALGAADVGVAIGAGTDVAIETADAVLLHDRLTDVPALIRLSRQTMRNIRQNVAIALGLKGVFLVTSVLGLTGLWLAVLADTGATVLVTANALRLLRFDPLNER
ncbi:heavy metal translocating P-type ATPase [Rhodobacter capsulatus]|uniref:heavy metal translocating P-type ATPase n=1 Tax=Rhodobacter capsulatus TaxID=1061 RepID=UPI0040251F2E